MRDNMLVNMSGLSGHAMPIDLNIEHLIGKLKVYNGQYHSLHKLTVDRPSYGPRAFSRHGINLEISQLLLIFGCNLRNR